MGSDSVRNSHQVNNFLFAIIQAQRRVNPLHVDGKKIMVQLINASILVITIMSVLLWDDRIRLFLIVCVILLTRLKQTRCSLDKRIPSVTKSKDEIISNYTFVKKSRLNEQMQHYSQV